MSRKTILDLKEGIRDLENSNSILRTHLNDATKKIMDLNHELTFTNQSIRSLLWALSTSQRDLIKIIRTGKHSILFLNILAE